MLASEGCARPQHNLVHKDCRKIVDSHCIGARTSPAPVQHLPQAVQANLRGGSAYKPARASRAAALSCGGDRDCAAPCGGRSGEGAQESAASAACLARPGPRGRALQKPAQDMRLLHPWEPRGGGGGGGASRATARACSDQSTYSERTFQSQAGTASTVAHGSHASWRRPGCLCHAAIAVVKEQGTAVCARREGS